MLHKSHPPSCTSGLKDNREDTLVQKHRLYQVYQREVQQTSAETRTGSLEFFLSFVQYVVLLPAHPDVCFG